MADNGRTNAWTKLKAKIVEDFGKAPRTIKAGHAAAGSATILALIALGFLYIRIAYPQLDFRLPASATRAVLEEGGTAAPSLVVWNLWWALSILFLCVEAIILLELRLNRMHNQVVAERLKQPLILMLGSAVMLPFLWMADTAGVNHGSEMFLRTSAIAADAAEQVAERSEYDRDAFLSLLIRLVSTDAYELIDYDELPNTYQGWVDRNAAATEEPAP